MYRGSSSRWRPVWPALLLAVVVLIATAALAGRVEAQDPPIPPGPLDPDNGEQTLLDIINQFELQDIINALDNFPVPYVVYATANGADPTVEIKKAGSPIRIDADRSKSTGQGGSGHDIEVEVNTVLFPTPGLELTVNRLGTLPFATDLQVVIAFPFAAFGDESDNGNNPNLFVGYQTTAPFDVLTETYPAGGRAPLSVQYFITPGALAGTDHTFDLSITTMGATNPIQFLAGHFEAVPGDDLADAIAMGILTDPVPTQIDLGITTSASLPGGGTTAGSFEIDWSASAPTKAIFDYIENEDFPIDGDPNYGTSIEFNQMPTQQTVDVDVDFAAQTIGLSLAGNAPINEVDVRHRRDDGLDVHLEAFQVPTQVDADLDLGGSVVIGVNANTMDFELTATQDGGFPGSDAVLGYLMEFLYAAATDVPDATATWNAAQVNIAAVNAGESIGSIAFVLDDDAREIEDPEVQLPPDQSSLLTGVGIPWDEANRHIFSVVDDGTHGTLAARLTHVIDAQLNLTTPDLQNIAQSYTIELAEPAEPLTAYARLTPDSDLTDEDIDAFCNVHDFPHGVTTFDLGFPPPKLEFSFDTVPDGQSIEELFCLGRINTLNFEVLGGDIPEGTEVEFIPASADPGGQGSLTVTTPTQVGTFGVRFWDDVSPNGLDATGFDTVSLLGTPLKDARFRADGIPSLAATWKDFPGSTNIDVDTVGAAFVGGVQVGVSTEIAFAPQFPAASASSEHYLSFVDQGPGEVKTLRAGVFGVDSVHYASTEGGGARTIEASYATDGPRPLEVSLDSRFGGRFFPDYDIDATLTVDSVPQSWSIETDLATYFESVASSASIDTITVIGDIRDHRGITGSGGTVTYAANKLTDTSKAFAENALKGGFVYVGDKIATIASNTATEITLTGDWPGGQPDDGDAYSIVGETHVDALIAGLPTSVTLDIDPTIEGGAVLTLSSDLDQVTVDLSSELSVIGTDYKFILVEISDIPATWTAEWGLQPNPHASLSTSSPLGPIHLILSKVLKSETGTQLAPFMQPGATVDYSDYARTIDERYLTAGPFDEGPVLMPKLDGLYDSSASLADGEDHIVIREDNKFLSVQGSGFQCASVQLGSGSLECDPAAEDPAAGELQAIIAIPTVGDHPFYVGLEQETDRFLVVDIPNIPDSTSALVGLSRAVLAFAQSPGDIIIYKGALPQGGDGEDVLKFQIVNTPTSMTADWVLDFPGHLNLTLSNPTEVRFVSQSASSRVAGAFEVEGLGASWGTISLSPNPECSVLPPGCNVNIVLVGVFANVHAIGEPIDGFLQQYDLVGEPRDLNGPGPDPVGAEYVPRVSFLMDNFESLEISAGIEVCVAQFGLLPCAFGVPLPFVDIDLDVGGVVFDWWDMGGTALGDEDYFENNPWHFYPWNPLLHSFGDHIFPFGP